MKKNMDLISQNNLGWKILTHDEKVALGLQIVQGKSSWEAGEILNRAHYKYLEIKLRAQKFLKIFTEHYKMFGDLFPEDLTISPRLKKYFYYTIVERKSIRKAAEKIDTTFKVPDTRNGIIMEEMKKWENSEILSETMFYNLIKDFDRWNNFRILPTDLQEPSAFKRRNKNRWKKQMKVVSEKFNDYKVNYITKKFGYKGDNNLNNGGAYIGIITNKKKKDYKIIKVRLDKAGETISELSKEYILIFKKESQALEFVELTLYYFENITIRHCKEGQVFWPKYRTLIKYAINHNEVERIPIKRLSSQDKAMMDSDIKITRESKSS